MLAYIHSQQVVHRDLKPENLVFSKEGYLHLTDFGISSGYLETSKRDNSGTPGYMAPETFMSKRSYPASDFWALGVIAYELSERKVRM